MYAGRVLCVGEGKWHVRLQPSSLPVHGMKEFFL